MPNDIPWTGGIPVDSMLLGGPVQTLLGRGLKLGKLGLNETGVDVVWSHLGDVTGISKFGGAE